MLLYFHKKSQDKHNDLLHRKDSVSAELAAKYITYSLLTNAVVLLVFMGPLLIFSAQNYETLKTLAYDKFPQLLVHLEQETRWLYFFSVSSFFAILAFSALWTYKACKDMTASLNKIQHHMRHVFHDNGLSHPFDVNEQDVLKNFIANYESFIYHLKESTQSELSLLEKLNLDPSRKDSYKAWLDLIQMKKDRLGMEAPVAPLTILNGEASDESERQRHVS